MANNYQTKINRALKHIDTHLSEEINVRQLADLSGFSMFHFSRIFKALVGETPYEILLRLRLERAVFLLKYNQELKVAEVGYESGFSTAENFSRQFKARFDISPGAFRKNKNLHNSRIYQEANPDDFYIRIEKSRDLKEMDFYVVIEELPEISIAYAKAVFGADGSGLVEKYMELMDWAQSRQIKFQGSLTRFGMSIDNPEVTPASKYRYDFAIKTDQDYRLIDGIELGTIPSGAYATIHVKGKLENVAQAWDYLYKTWLPSSEFVPVHYPALEEFIQGPEEIGWENFNLKCRVPIKKQ